MKKFTMILALALALTVFAGCQGINNNLQLPASNGGQANAETISPEAAQQIALDHAGLKMEDVAGLRTETDYDDGRSHYDVEFYSGDFEYSYEIDKSGNILKNEKDHEPKPTAAPTVQATEPTVAPTQPTVPAVQPGGIVTKEAAQQIALEHAGFTADSVRFLKVEFDREDNTYEVEFSKDGFEYSYEIHAESGNILETDKDRDD